MHETPKQIHNLQELLNHSYHSAGKHLQSIHNPAWRMSAEEVCLALVQVCVLDLATVSSDARPFVAPVDGLFLNGRFWFGSSHSSQRFRHIRNNPQVSAAYTKGEDVSILVHGIANEIDTTTGDYEFLRKYCLEVYGTEFESWNNWGSAPYAWIEPTRMYAIRIDHDPAGTTDVDD